MEIEKLLKDLRRCADFEAHCKECSYVNAGNCIGDITKAAAEVIKELIADRDVWAERWAEEHNARLRAEENAGDFKCVRNELCERCGKYKEAYKGACKGCRWEDK